MVRRSRGSRSRAWPGENTRKLDETVRRRALEPLGRSRTLHRCAWGPLWRSKTLTGVLGRFGVRKHCTGVLGSHHGARKHCTGVLGSHFGAREHRTGALWDPLWRKTLHRASSATTWTLENTALACAGAPWTRTRNIQKSSSEKLPQLQHNLAPLHSGHLPPRMDTLGFTLVYIYIYSK